MIFSFLKANWIDVAQLLGVVVSLGISLLALSRSTRNQLADFHFSVGESHDRIWSRLFEKPSLGRIREDDLDLSENPITYEEEQLVLLVMSHLTSTLQAIRLGKYPDSPSHRADVKEFFSKPIPAAVYTKHHDGQQEILRRFVDESKTPETTSHSS